MKAPWFDYRAPRALGEALSVLADAGPDARVLAGGQSLMPMMNMRVLAPTALVDINRVVGLRGLEAADGELVVGALVRHADLLRSAEIRERWPLVAEATRHVAHPAIRNRGTVCGSVSHNDPAAEHPSVLSTLDGTVVVASVEGTREVAAEDFFEGMLATALEPGEMVVEIRYRRPPEGTGHGFHEFARRLGDFAIAGAAALLTVRGGVCERARVTILGMGDGPFRARAAEGLLTGARLDGPDASELLAEAAADVMDEVEPADDVHASSAYRRHLAGVMARRALRDALARTEGGARAAA